MQDQQQLELIFSCPFCRFSAANLQAHLQLQCLNLVNIQLKKKGSFEYKGNISVCLRCYVQVNSNQMRDHLRSCKRNLEKSLRDKSSQLSSISAQTEHKKQTSTLHPLQFTPSTQQQSFSRLSHPTNLESLEANTVQIFQNFLLSSTQPFLIQWIKDHSEFRKIFLYTIFQKFVNQMEKRLYHRIPRLQWSDFGNNLSFFEWNKRFKRPQQVFDRQFVIDSIKNIDKQEKTKVLGRVNKIYAKYPDFTQKFKVQREHAAPKNIPKPLCHIELIDIVEKLLETKVAKYVHIALDLMILFQAGQRYPSSIPIIQQVLLKYLHDKESSLFFKTSKTNKIVMLIISEQLLKMLREFEWKGFYCNKRFANSYGFYSRISKYFPFTIYAIRHGYMCFLEMMQSSISANSNLLSQHSKKENMKIYTQSVINKRLQSYKNLLKFPNCKIETSSKQDIFSKLPKTDQLFTKIKLEQNWFVKFYQQFQRDDASGDPFNFLQNQVMFVAPPQQSDYERRIEQIIEDQNEEDSESSAQDIKEQVKINGRCYQRINQRFNLKSLTFPIKAGVCSSCLMKIQKEGLQCLFCGDQFHTSSPCLLQFCPCLECNLEKKGISIEPLHDGSLEIHMCKSYIDQNDQYLKQVRFLTHARGFSFTNTSVCHLSAIKYSKSALIDMNIGEIKLKNFQLYRELRYMPPLKLKVTNIDNDNGTGFGLEADQDIQKKVFIGQYAADLILRNQTYLLRRTDMTMSIVRQHQSKYSLQIAPLKYNGYCTLINEDKVHPNCAAAICIIDNEVKVIIYTLRRIRKGEELTYDYQMKLSGNHQEYEDSSAYGLPEQINISQPFDKPVNQQMKSINNTNKGIINNGNSCYVNCILQLLRTFQSYFRIPSLCTDSFFIKLRKFYSSVGKFNPRQIIRQVDKSNRFGIRSQQDAHQFLDYCISMFEKIISIDFMIGHHTRQLLCAQCNATINLNETYRELFILPSQPLNDIVQRQDTPVDYLCENTKCLTRGSTTIKTVITSFPKLLMIYVSRFKEGIKDHTQAILPNRLELNGSNFQLVFLVLHSGHSMNNGHYMSFDCKNGILYDDEHVTLSSACQPKQIYMAMFESIPKEQEKTIPLK